MLELTKIEKRHYTEFINEKLQTGFLYYTYNKKTITVLFGKNTEGEEIGTEEFEYDTEVEKLNPTQIFLIVAKVLREKLCPECRTLPK